MRRHRILSPLLLTLCVPWAAVSCGSDGGDLGGPRGHVMSVEVSPPQARRQTAVALRRAARPQRLVVTRPARKAP